MNAHDDIRDKCIAARFFNRWLLVLGGRNVQYYDGRRSLWRKIWPGAFMKGVISLALKKYARKDMYSLAKSACNIWTRHHFKTAM